MPRYIGGTTQTYEFDFFTKTAGSTVVCPLKIYGQDVDLASLPNPSTGWTENTTQSELDMLKQQDSIALAKSTTTSGKARAMMIELDLTEITQNVYGNSNANMKSNFQTTSNIDLYVLGSGANAGATSYGCKSYAWNNTTSTWELLGENTNSTIQLTNRVLNKADFISATNKTYILLVPSYPSDGTIVSSISLDYLKFKMNFNRTADSVVPLTHNFANKWTILLKDLFFVNTNNPKPIKVGSIDINLNSIISSKKMHNVLIYQDGTNIKYYALVNNGTLQSGTVSASLVLGTQNITFNTSDYYFGMIYVLNNYNPADSNEGLAILKGEKTGFENAELLYSSEFDDVSKWTLSNNATISNKKLILSDFNSTATQNVFVFPNNQYEIQLTKKDQMGVVEVEEYYSKNSDVNSSVSNDVFIRSQILGAGLTKFTTSAYTNKIRVKLKNQLEGFSRSSVAYMSDGTQVANNVPRLEVVSGNDKAILIEEGTTNLISNSSFEIDSNSDGLADGWDTTNGGGALDTQRIVTTSLVTALYGSGKAQKIEINQTGDIAKDQMFLALNNVSVLPNTIYTLSAYIRTNTTNKVYLLAREYENSTIIRDNNSSKVMNSNQIVKLTLTFTTSSNCNKLQVTVRGINQVGDWFEVSAIQLEQKPYPTSFVDGTRQPEILKVPTAGILNPSEGTIEVKFYVDDKLKSSTTTRRIFSHTYSSSDNRNRITLQRFIDGYYIVALADAQGSASTVNIFDADVPNGWVTISIAWNSQQIRVFANTTKVGTVNNPKIPSGLNPYIALGSDGLYYFLNSAISDFHISSIARSDADIQTRATNGFVVDQYSTYALDFNSLSGAEFNNISLKEKF